MTFGLVIALGMSGASLWSGSPPAAIQRSPVLLAQAKSRAIDLGDPRPAGSRQMRGATPPGTQPTKDDRRRGLIRKVTPQDLPIRSPTVRFKGTQPPTKQDARRAPPAGCGTDIFRPCAIIVDDGPSLRAIVNDPKSIVVDDSEAVLDSRAAVSGAMLAELPFSAIGRIVATFAGGDATTGTGFLVSPSVVLTAAHVLHDWLHNFGPAVKVEFTPGCRANFPDGAPNSQTVGRSRWRVSEGWTRTSDQKLASDYGAIFLPDARQFADCGTLAVRDVENSYVERHARLFTRSFIVAGFPEDKPFGTLWFAPGRLIASAVSEVNHKIDTIPGQSGAPLMAVIVGNLTGERVPLAVAIHSRPSAPGLNFNQARRIDDRVLKDLKRWAEEIAETDE